MKTKREWIERLQDTQWSNVLQEVATSHSMDEEMSANEVLDAIVSWEGGLASGWQVHGLVELVYGVELDGAQW